MRRNNFSSAADRRWQRRYERIQQRREDELERRDRRGRDAEERIEELLRRQEEETLRRHLEEEQRRMREEREREMWADFERWLRHQHVIFDDITTDVEFCIELEPEPELKVGDASELDSFLGNFLAPGA